MALSPQERSVLRYFLGRRDDAIQKPHLLDLESALSRITLDGEERVRATLVELEALEKALRDTVSCVAVSSVDNVRFRGLGQQRAAIRAEGRRTIRSLASYLNVYVMDTPFGTMTGAIMTQRG